MTRPACPQRSWGQARCEGCPGDKRCPYERNADDRYLEQLGYAPPARDSHRRKGRVRLS